MAAGFISYLFRAFLLVPVFSMSVYVTAVRAEEVSLKLKKGDLIFTGDLTSFDGKTFVLKTSNYGQISVDTTKFECISSNCNMLLETFLMQQKNTRKQRLQPETYINFLGKENSDFSIHGSNTIGSRLMPELIHGFARRNGYLVEYTGDRSSKETEIVLKRRNGETVVKVDLKRHGSATAFPALETEKAQIGMSDRRIMLNEAVSLEKAGFPGMLSPQNEHVIGVDGILIIVSNSNTVTSLSMQQIAKIFAGEIKNWSEVGGPAGRINVYAPDDKSGTFGTFKSLILKPGDHKLIENAVRLESNEELSRRIATDPNGIGITGFAYKGSSRALSIASSCGITHTPTQFSVSTDEYPLSRRLYLYTSKPVRNKYALALLSYSKDSASTDHVLKNAGFISRGIMLQPFHEQGQRMAGIFASPSEDFDMNLMRQFSKDLRHASRLSFTVRFNPSSSNHDSESQQLFGQLGKFIVANKLEKNYFVLAGFSDSQGGFQQNIELSRSRAAQVAQMFAQSTRGFIDPARIIVKSYGELMPVACNDTDEGRARNRRVEIWTVKPENWPLEPILQASEDNRITQKFPAQ